MFSFARSRPVLSFLFFVSFSGLSAAAPAEIDLASGLEDVVVYGIDEKDGLTAHPSFPNTSNPAHTRAVTVGDLNGDGNADLVLGATGGDGPSEARPNAGEAYVLFGPLPSGAQIDLASRPPDVRVCGALETIQFGCSVAAGDLNGDGTDDLAVGARGFTYVLFGPFASGVEVDLETSPADVKIIAQAASDAMGAAVEVGEVSGDGVDDLIIGAPEARGRGPDGYDAGKAYVLFGPLGSSSVIRIGSPMPDVVVYGAGYADGLGAALATGDVNGDGLGDLVLGTFDNGGRIGDRIPGYAYVLFGPLVSGAQLDLSITDADIEISGRCPPAESALFGVSVAAGDVNGDGIEDLLAGAMIGQGPPGASRRRSGDGYVFFGPLAPGTKVDLNASSADVEIYGAERGDELFHVAAGDVNGDGIEDLLVAAHSAEGRANSRPGSGEAYILFGPLGGGARFDLSTAAPDVTIFGADARDSLSLARKMADVTGNGIADIILSASPANGPSNSRKAAGEAYLIDFTWVRADAGGGYAVECAGTPSRIVLDGTRSWNFGSSPVQYEWSTDCPGGSLDDPSSTTPELSLDGPPPCPVTCSVTLKLTDAANAVFSDDAEVTVQDTIAPVLVGVPADAKAECDSVPPPAAASALDGCDSSPLVSFAETKADGPCEGTYDITRTWSAADLCGNQSGPESQVITVVDVRPPVIQPGDRDLACLWPPNHWYVCFDTTDFTPDLDDNCSGSVTWSFTDCRSDQPDDGRGDGNTRDDCAVVDGGRSICVRSERAAYDPAGRRYAVTVEAEDDCGNRSGPVVIGNILVPHDKRYRKMECLNAVEVGCKAKTDALPCRSDLRRR